MCRCRCCGHAAVCLLVIVVRFYCCCALFCVCHSETPLVLPHFFGLVTQRRHYLFLTMESGRSPFSVYGICAGVPQTPNPLVGLRLCQSSCILANAWRLLRIVCISHWRRNVAAPCRCSGEPFLSAVGTRSLRTFCCNPCTRDGSSDLAVCNCPSPAA